MQDKISMGETFFANQHFSSPQLLLSYYRSWVSRGCPPEGMGPARIYRPRGHITNTHKSSHWTESQLHIKIFTNPLKLRSLSVIDKTT